MIRIPSLIVLILVCGVSAAFAFDGVRPGFTMALQVGVGQSEYTVADPAGDRSYDGLALAARWRLGYSPTAPLWIYAVNRTQYFEGEGPDDRVQGLTGLGVSWFFEENLRWPIYVVAEGGLASHRNRVDSSDADGFGFALGLGLELRRHFTLEASWLSGSVSADGMPDQDLQGFALTFGWIGY